MSEAVGRDGERSAGDRLSALTEALRSRRRPTDARWRVQVYDPADPADVVALAALLDDAAPGALEVVDTLDAQVRDLLRAQRGGDRPSDVEVAAWLADVAPQGVQRWGRWVLQPWRRRLVRTLPPALHRRLRLDRNRLKITADEQVQLGAARIAVAGLSVGQAIAVCMAQEGVGGTFHLADFDTLDLSNLNRLRADVGDLGLPKLALTGRALAGVDPFLTLVGFAEGVDPANLDAFLCTADGRPVDLLVEECDDLPLKVQLRERARVLGVPVLMATAEGGLLDLERFDLEPARPLLHGLVDGVDLSALRAGDEGARVAFVMAAMGLGVLSPRTAASLLEMGQTVASWPQLASSVALGAAMVTDVARRLALGQSVDSGRATVALDQLLTPPGPQPAARGAPATPAQVETLDPRDAPSPSQLQALGAAAAAARTGSATFVGAAGDALRQALTDVAVLAPSGGNAQPWRLTWRGDTLRIEDDPDRPVPAMDPGRVSVRMAAGSVAELVLLAAPACGLVATLTAPEPWAPRWHVDVRLTPGPGEVSPLLDAARRRFTCRDVVAGQALPTALADAVRAAGAPAGVDLVTERAALRELGRLAGQADRLRFLLPSWRRELAGELRWSADEARATGDGMDVATLGLDAAGQAGLPLMLHGPALDTLAELRLGSALTTPALDAFTDSAAALVLRPPTAEGCPLFAAGRALVRTWLALTNAGWSLHPWGSALFVSHLSPDVRGTLPRWAQDEVARIAAAVSDVPALATQPPAMMLARVVRGALAPDAPRSLRRRHRATPVADLRAPPR